MHNDDGAARPGWGQHRRWGQRLGQHECRGQGRRWAPGSRLWCSSGAVETWGGSSAAMEALGGKGDGDGHREGDGGNGGREGDGGAPANFGSLTVYYAKSSKGLCSI
jgi:hypothetical protein